ncbi:MAG: hypothetical protein BRD25_01585 [Bacteroidetes bacterium QH_1_61_8]|nr:MAG: hypothetical protein BRD25_01585 [Bacteroidetes bacterium QH_1_61_8]
MLSVLGWTRENRRAVASEAMPECILPIEASSIAVAAATRPEALLYHSGSSIHEETAPDGLST